MKTALILSVALTLGACTSMTTPVEIGQGRYLMGATARGGLNSDTELKTDTIKKAAEFCKAKGKDLVLLTSESTGLRGWSPQNAELTFRCE